MPLFSFPSRVNERAARLVAAGAATSSLVALASGASWLVPIIAGGFLLRVGWGPLLSPTARLAMWGAPKLWETRLVAGAPKRFAQAIGAALTVAASVLIALGHPTLSGALLATIALFATLEAALSFCLGCWLYGQFQRLGIFPADSCAECVT
jgi:hypothetical protein